MDTAISGLGKENPRSGVEDANYGEEERGNNDGNPQGIDVPSIALCQSLAHASDDARLSTEEAGVTQRVHESFVHDSTVPVLLAKRYGGMP